jgi:hypothetical protein
MVRRWFDRLTTNGYQAPVFALSPPEDAQIIAYEWPARPAPA